jgi:hypothetical protein
MVTSRKYWMVARDRNKKKLKQFDIQCSARFLPLIRGRKQYTGDIMAARTHIDREFVSVS